MADADMECGFCCVKIVKMKEPVTLPCGHVHCLDCIKGFYDDKKVMRCPEEGCEMVVDGPLSNLRSYMSGTRMCDICFKKKHKQIPATCWCSKCESYYCEIHKQLHEEVTIDHDMILLTELETKSKRQKEEKCEKHKDHILSIGCGTCMLPFCIKCLAKSSTCKEGSPHRFMSLDDLVSELLSKKLIKDMVAREGQLEKIFKKTSKTVAEHDTQTEKGLQTLRKTREEHLRVLKEKYDQLENEWVESREKQKEKLTDFLDDEVLIKWNRIRDQIQGTESKIKQAHQVEVLRSFKELMAVQEKAVDEGLPRLVVKGSISLAPKGKSREIELEVAPADDVIIVDDDSMFRLPEQTTHLKTVKLPACPLSLCHKSGYLYVGMDNHNIARIDRSFSIDQSFITCSAQVYSIAVYKDRVYTLLASSPYTVCVFDMLGKRLAFWVVSCSSNNCNALAVVSDEVVVAEQPHSRLAVFSLSGQLHKHVPCTLIGQAHTFISSVDDSSIIISDSTTAKVSRFNITTGKVEWSVSVTNPRGVCCYGSRYLLVGRYSRKNIQIVDLVTGTLVSEIVDGRMTGGRVYGLQTLNFKLAVADVGYKQVQIFNLTPT
ncbi:uncharacterized protein [Watersipora subatra]|uniref:uncharacterized protein n=1 Tax=Watersipora subatra TaxID=2589382 RepID=UPI00355C4069